MNTLAGRKLENIRVLSSLKSALSFVYMQHNATKI